MEGAATRQQHLVNHIKGKHQKDKHREEDKENKCHMKEDLNCESCPYATTRRQYLMKHIKAEHPKGKHLICSKCPYRSSDSIAAARAQLQIDPQDDASVAN